MSRGPGRVMQATESALTAKWQTLAELAKDVFDTDPPAPSQVESVRRAVKGLVQLERATTFRTQTFTDVSCRNGRMWQTTTSVRHPLTPEEDAEERRGAMERMKALTEELGRR